MSALQIIVDRLNRQIDDLNDSIITSGIARQRAEGTLRELVRERDCPERQCSLQRPGQRSFDAIKQDTASAQRSIARHDTSIAKASWRRDMLTVWRNGVNRYVRPSVVH